MTAAGAPHQDAGALHRVIGALHGVSGVLHGIAGSLHGIAGALQVPGVLKVAGALHGVAGAPEYIRHEEPPPGEPEAADRRRLGHRGGGGRGAGPHGVLDGGDALHRRGQSGRTKVRADVRMENCFGMYWPL